MHLSRRSAQAIVVGAAIVGAAAVGFFSGPGAADAPRAHSRSRAPRGRTFPGLDPVRHRIEDGATVADLRDGSTALLSIDPGLQAHAERVYRQYRVPLGALVAIEPATGRVLAYVSHRSDGEGDVVLDASPPAASVFKVVTGSALIDAGVDPSVSVCYHGGSGGLNARHLEDDPRDQSCATLADAMGESINSIFGKLAVRHLDAPTLSRYASAFGFGQSLPFDVPIPASASEVPAERLELARTAAGFWHMHMSPMHGALIAATIANGGRMPRATLVDQVIDARGRTSYRARPEVFRTVIPASTAHAVDRMMRSTVTSGTARHYFYDERGNPFLPGIDVAGKTGSLTGANPYRAYTWFIGFAPADRPSIAVAALVVNEPLWRIKAAYAAREAMRYWLVERPRQLQAAQNPGT